MQPFLLIIASSYDPSMYTLYLVCEGFRNQLYAQLYVIHCKITEDMIEFDQIFIYKFKLVNVFIISRAKLNSPIYEI